jgi:hypothetical protein
MIYLPRIRPARVAVNVCLMMSGKSRTLDDNASTLQDLTENRQVVKVAVIYNSNKESLDQN